MSGKYILLAPNDECAEEGVGAGGKVMETSAGLVEPEMLGFEVPHVVRKFSAPV